MNVGHDLDLLAIREHLGSDPIGDRLGGLGPLTFRDLDGTRRHGYSPGRSGAMGWRVLEGGIGGAGRYRGGGRLWDLAGRRAGSAAAERATRRHEYEGEHAGSFQKHMISVSCESSGRKSKPASQPILWFNPRHRSGEDPPYAVRVQAICGLEAVGRPPIESAGLGGPACRAWIPELLTRSMTIE